MSTTREITKQGRDGTSVQLLLRSTDPLQRPLNAGQDNYRTGNSHGMDRLW
jgi:hypothetical protein